MKKFGFSHRHQQGSLPYQKWMREELCAIVRKSLHRLLSSPRVHIIYITFRTDHPGVVVPDIVLENFPSTVRIFLRTGRQKSIILNESGVIIAFGIIFFDGKKTTISIPINSIVSFYDRESNTTIHLGNPLIAPRGNVVPLRQW